MYYVKQTQQKEKTNEVTKKNSIHRITSPERDYAETIVKWCLAVAKLPADSPRFAWYVSRWDVPTKIARAIAEGTLNDSLKDCPPIDPAWLRFVPAALEAHREFVEKHFRPRKPINAPALSARPARSA